MSDRNQLQLIASVVVFITSPFGPGRETFHHLPEMTKAGGAVSEAPLPSGGRTAPHVSPVQLRQHCGPCHFLPFLPFLLASARSLTRFFPDLLMSAERQRDSFPCLKIQASPAVSAVDRFTRQKWAPVVKYSKRAEHEVSGCSFFSFSFFFVSWAALAVLVSRAYESAPIFSLRNNVCGLRGFNHAAIIIYQAYIKRTLLQQ